MYRNIQKPVDNTNRPSVEECLDSLPFLPAWFEKIHYAQSGLMPWIQYSKEIAKTVWEQVPPFFQCSLMLFYYDCTRLLLAYSILHAAESSYQSCQQELPVIISYWYYGMLIAFQGTLTTMSWLQKPQSSIHSSILLLKMPNEWQKMPRTDVPKLETAVCASCNKLREIKGDIRSNVLYFFQQMVLSGIRLLPFGAMISLPFHILFMGRTVAEYRYRTEGICERHIETTYQHHREFFAVLGLCHFVGMWMSGRLLENMSGMPNYAHDTCISGILMLALVRLTYSMKKFPSPVGKTDRYFPSLGTRRLVDTVIDFSVFKLKRSLRDKEETLELLGNCRDRMTFLQSLCVHFKSFYIKKSGKHERISSLLRWVLPPMFRSKNHFYNDSISGPWFWDQLKQCQLAVKKLIQYRRLILSLSEKTKHINQFRNHSVVTVGLRWFGGIFGTINDMFTLNFLINQCPDYIQNIKSIVEMLQNAHLISSKWIADIMQSLEKLGANLKVIQKIMSEFPDSSREEFFNLLADPRFEEYLHFALKFLNTLPIAHVDACEDSDEEKALYDMVTTCAFSDVMEIDACEDSKDNSNEFMVGDDEYILPSINVGRLPPETKIEQVSSGCDYVVVSLKQQPRDFDERNFHEEEWDNSDVAFTIQ